MSGDMVEISSTSSIKIQYFMLQEYVNNRDCLYTLKKIFITYCKVWI